MGHNTFTPRVATAATAAESLAVAFGKGRPETTDRKVATFGFVQVRQPAAPKAERPAKAAKTERPKASPKLHACRCAAFGTGCDSQTARVFAPGHDAKLGSLLQKAALAGELVRDEETGTEVPALQAASWFPFGAKVIARVAQAVAKAKAAQLSFAG